MGALRVIVFTHRASESAGPTGKIVDASNEICLYSATSFTNRTLFAIISKSSIRIKYVKIK